jgi:hypothetical protein
MSLYTRLLDLEPSRPKIPVHLFQATLAEWARGKLSDAQAQAIISAAGGVPLNASEAADATAIKNLVTSIPVSGSAAAQADGRAQRAMKVQEIDAVFLLMDARAAGYDTEAGIKAKLGIA